MQSIFIETSHAGSRIKKSSLPSHLSSDSQPWREPNTSRNPPIILVSDDKSFTICDSYYQGIHGPRPDSVHFFRLIQPVTSSRLLPVCPFESEQSTTAPPDIHAGQAFLGKPSPYPCSIEPTCFSGFLRYARQPQARSSPTTPG